jgi:hypothetical protein
MHRTQSTYNLPGEEQTPCQRTTRSVPPTAPCPTPPSRAPRQGVSRICSTGYDVCACSAVRRLMGPAGRDRECPGGGPCWGLSTVCCAVSRTRGTEGVGDVISLRVPRPAVRQAHGPEPSRGACPAVPGTVLHPAAGRTVRQARRGTLCARCTPRPLAGASASQRGSMPGQDFALEWLGAIVHNQGSLLLGRRRSERCHTRSGRAGTAGAEVRRE